MARSHPVPGLRPIRCAEPGCRFVFWTAEPDAAVITSLVRAHLRDEHDSELNDH